MRVLYVYSLPGFSMGFSQTYMSQGISEIELDQFIRNRSRGQQSKVRDEQRDELRRGVVSARAFDRHPGG